MSGPLAPADAVAFRATPRRALWFAGDPVVIDLEVDNPTKSTRSFPNPMLAGSPSPVWRLRAPDGTADTFSMASAGQAVTRVTLSPGERWAGELVLRGRARAAGRWELSGELEVDGAAVACEPAVFEVTDARFNEMVVSLSLDDEGEAGREALLLHRAGAGADVFARVLREANPRLAEADAGPTVARGALPADAHTLLAPFSNRPASLDPLRWRVALTGSSVVAGTNLSPDTVALPVPPGTRAWAALSGPGARLRVIVSAPGDAPALVCLGVDAPDGTPRAVAPVTVTRPSAAPVVVAATLGGERDGSPVVLAAVYAEGDHLPPGATDGEHPVDAPTLLAMPPSTRVTVTRATIDGASLGRVTHRVMGVRPTRVASVWLARGGDASCAFVAYDLARPGELCLVDVSWRGPVATESVTPLPVAGRDVRRAWLTAWERRGRYDRFLCLQLRDGSARVMSMAHGLREGRMPVEASAPVGFMPGVDRWYVVQLAADGRVSADPI